MIGRDGHVTGDCREQLPYVDAVLPEVMRIRPVVPNGIFHEVVEDIKLGMLSCVKVVEHFGISVPKSRWFNRSIVC